MTTIPTKSLLSSFLLCQAFNGFAAPDAGTYEKNLTDKDPAVREAAARALKAWQDPASLAALIKGAKDPVADIRALCVEALGEFPDPAAHQAVLSAAKDAAPEVRATVMREFAYAATPDVVPVATAALSDPDPSVRANAAEAIDFYAKLQMPAERETLLNDADPAVQASAARALLQAGDDQGEGVNMALDLIKSDNQTARLLAIDALGYSQFTSGTLLPFSLFLSE